MRHVLYALFKEPSAANAAIHDIEAAGLSREVCNINVHTGRLNQDDLRHSESDARRGLLFGLIAGGVGGLILGLLLAGPLHLLNVGMPAAAAFGLAAGGLFGTLGGALSGAGLTDQRLQQLAGRLGEGNVLVTAEVEGMTTEGTVEQIFSRRGAIETSKPVL